MRKRGEDVIQFTIPGEPQGKARARTFYSVSRSRTVSVTPEKTVMYENLIKQCAYNEMTDAGDFWLSEPLSIRVVAYYGVPKSTTKSKRLAMLDGNIRPTKKPDADNVLKVVVDALNGVLYKDDTQIVNAQVQKFYSDTPRVEVWIRSDKVVT